MVLRSCWTVVPRHPCKRQWLIVRNISLMQRHRVRWRHRQSGTSESNKRRLDLQPKNTTEISPAIELVPVIPWIKNNAWLTHKWKFFDWHKLFTGIIILEEIFFFSKFRNHKLILFWCFILDRCGLYVDHVGLEFRSFANSTTDLIRQEKYPHS